MDGGVKDPKRTVRIAECGRASPRILAADLQNLQKAAGTAADLKTQATDAEKTLSEASAARASAQNELADLTKQITDAKLAISGAQEEASAKSRDLEAVSARLREESDRLTGMQTQDQALSAEQARLQGQVDAARSALAEAENQTVAAQKQFETISESDQRRRRRTQRVAEPDSATRKPRPLLLSDSLGQGRGAGPARRLCIVRRDRHVTNRQPDATVNRVAVMGIRTMDDFSAAQGTPAAESRKLRTPAELKSAVLAKLTYSVGKIPEVASPRDWFLAVAFATRDVVVDRWLESTAGVYADGRKRVYYLSLEFLIGRLLFDAMTNLGIVEPMAEALKELGVSLTELRRIEPDAALGNGGLGRLAACFMDSMATLRIAAHGYGIRYDNGLFRQIIRSGWQQETPEDWLANGNPWEFERPEVNYAIGFGGWVEMVLGEDERTRHVWHPAETVEAVGYDTPIVGWRGTHVNTLRLWSARAPDPFKLDTFNAGDFVGALSDTVRAEAISKVLYPSDATPAGQELRLRQEYFFASASLLDLIRRHVKQHQDVRTLGAHAAVQLNDTHPAIAVPELMRILIDLNGLEWDEAWTVTQATFSYTNHTLLPEALETWPVPLMERLLPRHMQIIYLLNAAHLDSARRRGFIDLGISRHPLADRRTRRQTGSDGQPRLCRIAQDQRRVSPPHGPDAQNGVP